jgi:predicted O-methyltransferase YrrM
MKPELVKNNIDNVLELGFAHGVSSCYIAGALEDNKLNILIGD